MQEVVLELMTLKTGDSLSIERRFPGGGIKFYCREVTITREPSPPTTEGGLPSGH